MVLVLRRSTSTGTKFSTKVLNSVQERLLGRAGAPGGGSGEAARWREGLGEVVPGVSFVN